MLLDAKVIPNAARWSGDTPLLAAVNMGNLLELVEATAGSWRAEWMLPESRTGQTRSCELIAVAANQMVNLFIEKGANVNAVSKNGYSPCCLPPSAATSTPPKALLDAKADPLFKAKDGGTAF